MSEERIVEGVRLSNPDKILYPEQGITKSELADYYVAVAHRMLPHVAGRPVTMVRCPTGSEKKCFYQRHSGSGVLPQLHEVTVPGFAEPYLYIDDVAGLIAMVQMGTLEIHPWGVTVERPDVPDRIIFDLDPDEGLGFDDVVAAAKEVRERLVRVGLESFVKTTGGKGLHVIVPIARRYGWDEVKALLARLRFRAATPRWYLLALVLGAVTLVPALVFLASGGSTDAGRVGSHLVLLPIHFLVVATIGGGLDEELGWRGMAQPLLQRRLSLLPANLVLGVIWALWHLPLWLDPTSAQSAYPFAVYTAVIVGHSLVTGYLYNASGGSLLVAVIAHSANNTFDGLRYAILGESGRHLLWQVILAAAAMGLGVATVVKTGGRLGIRADHSSNQGGHSEA